MKKILFGLLIIVWTSFGYAQKYAYVDTEYILNNIPEYKDAQEQIDELSLQWQKEIEQKFKAIDKMYKDYQAESVLLPEDLKKKREEDIVAAEKEAKDLQRKRFGKDGDLFKKRQELIKPIQDKVYNAIEKRAQEKAYVFVFDKASGTVTIIYADPKYDISDEILDDMGYKLNKKPTGTGNTGSGTKSAQPTETQEKKQGNSPGTPPVRR